MRRIAIAVIALTMLSGVALADDPDADDQAASGDTLASLDDTAFDTAFQCPETIADGDARIDEYHRYLDWARIHHPDWNMRKRLDVRYALLRHHACATTLANVANSARAPFTP